MRRKLREQILQCVRDSKLFDNAKLNIMAVSFVGWMLDECEASGVLCNFSSKKYHPLSHIFNDSYNDYLVVLNKLCGTGFVEYDEQALRVRVCNVTYLYKLKAEIYHKRKYKRQDEIKEQQNIFESIHRIRETILDKKSGMEIRNVIGRYEHEAESEVNPELRNDVELVLETPKLEELGNECFKIPDNLRPYLTSEPLTDKEIEEIEKMYREMYDEKSFNNMFLERIKLEEDRRGLSKKFKDIYVGLMIISNNGTVASSQVEPIRRELNRLMGSEYFKRTTVRDAIRKFEELKLINIKNDEDELVIEDYSYGFKGRYIVVTKKLFIDTLKKLTAAASRLFYWHWFGLNNGDGKDKFGNSGLNKTVLFKIAPKTNENNEAKERYEKVKRISRKRNKAELLEVMESLSDIFHFYSPADQPTVMIVKVRKDYYVRKQEANIIRQEIDPIDRYPKKAKIIEELIKNRYYKFNQEEKKALVKTFSRATRKVIDKIIGFVDNRIRQSIEECWEEKYRIQNVIGYTIDRYQKYKLDLLETL